MAHTINVDRETGIIYINFFGDINLNDVRQAAEEAWGRRNSDGPYLYLSIFRDSRLNLDTRELLHLHNYYEDIGVSKDMANAIVVPENDQLLEDTTIHEIAANLQHWKVKVFVDLQAAKNWLLDFIRLSSVKINPQ